MDQIQKAIFKSLLFKIVSFYTRNIALQPIVVTVIPWGHLAPAYSPVGQALLRVPLQVVSLPLDGDTILPKLIKWILLCEVSLIPICNLLDCTGKIIVILSGFGQVDPLTFSSYEKWGQFRNSAKYIMASIQLMSRGQFFKTIYTTVQNY